MVKVWAGAARHDFRYIRRSLPSLLASKLPPEARVILINDCSPNPRVAPFLDELACQHPQVEVWTNTERLGPNRGQEINFPRVVERFPDARFFVICDDDVIYHPGWLQRLIQVHDEAEQRGVRGIFAALNLPAKRTVGELALPTSEVIIKERHPALNWLLPRDVYERVGPIRDAGIAYDSDYWNRAAQLGIQAICMKPSYVQNIGYQGAYQCDDSHRAHDYVGRRDWYLRGRDLWLAIQRRTVGRARAWSETLQDGWFKRAGLSVYRGLRAMVRLGTGQFAK
jgi:hypothetical protein